MLSRPDMQEKFHAFGIETVGDAPEALAALIKGWTIMMGKVIRDAGIRAE